MTENFRVLLKLGNVLLGEPFLENNTVALDISSQLVHFPNLTKVLSRQLLGGDFPPPLRFKFPPWLKYMILNLFD